jgi:LysM repeat protein
MSIKNVLICCSFSATLFFSIPLMTSAENSHYFNKIEFVIDMDKVKIDGNTYNLDSTPVIKDNKAYISSRTIVNILGGSIKWYKKDNKILIRLNDEILYFWVGSKNIIQNGNKVSLAEKPILKNGKIYISIRSLGEILNYNINWINTTKSVVLNGKSKKNSENIIHIVKKGDTIWDLSNKYNITMNKIKESNNLDSDNIYIGQKLKIPKI